MKAIWLGGWVWVGLGLEVRFGFAVPSGEAGFGFQVGPLWLSRVETTELLGAFSGFEGDRSTLQMQASREEINTGGLNPPPCPRLTFCDGSRCSIVSRNRRALSATSSWNHWHDANAAALGREGGDADSIGCSVGCVTWVGGWGNRQGIVSG